VYLCAEILQDFENPPSTSSLLVVRKQEETVDPDLVSALALTIPIQEHHFPPWALIISTGWLGS
jgi:hypothetical protein